MSLNDQILDVLRDSRDPMTNREIRETLELDDANSSTRISGALHVMLAKELVERVDREEGGGYAYQLPSGERPAKQAQAKPRGRPPGRSTRAAPLATVPDAATALALTPAPPAISPNPPTHVAAASEAMNRRVLRAAAAELLRAAGNDPMPDERVAAIRELVRLAA